MPRPERSLGLRAAVVVAAALASLLVLPPLEVTASWSSLIREDDPNLGTQGVLERTFDVGDGLVVLLTGEAPRPAAAAAEVAETLAGWPEIGAAVGPKAGLVPPGTLSPSGNCAAVYVETRAAHGGGAWARRLVERLRALPAPEGVELSVAGGVVEEVDIAQGVERDQLFIVPLVFIGLVVIGSLLLRSFGGAVCLTITLGAVLLLTLGALGVLHGRITSVTSLLVPVVVTIAAANAIHLIARFRHDRAAYGDAGLPRTLRQGGRACLLAAGTTGMGFLALLVMRIPDFTDLAIMGTIGCAITFVVVVGLLPWLLVRLDGRARELRVPFLGIVRLAARDLRGDGRTGHVLLVALFLLGLGVFRLGSDTRGLDEVPPDSDLPRVAGILDRDLAGTFHLDVVWRAPEPLDDAAGRARLAAAEAAIREAVPAARAVWSPASAWTILEDGVGETVAATLGPGLLRGRLPGAPRLVTDDGRTARLTVMLPTGSTRDVVERAAATERAMASVTGPGDEVGVAGPPRLIADAVEAIVQGQALAILLSIGLVSLLAAVALGSWRVLPVIWIPNLAPLLAVAGLLGWLEVPVSVSTAVVGSVVFGLVVDDTLHFLYALREEPRDEGAPLRALNRLGPAFLATSLLLLAGAAITSLGRTPPVAVFSRLMAFGVGVGLLCDVFLTPRVAARMLGFRGTGTEGPGEGPGEGPPAGPEEPGARSSAG